LRATGRQSAWQQGPEGRALTICYKRRCRGNVFRGEGADNDKHRQQREFAMKFTTQVIRLMILVASTWALSAQAQAQVPDSSPPLQLARLSPEERQQMREQMREHWKQMPPEERESYRQKRRERWEQMPPEERQRKREERRARDGGGKRDR